MPTSLNLLDLFSNSPPGFGATQNLDMTQPAYANTLADYKTTHQQALVGVLSDIANSSINKDEFYNRMMFAYLTTILEAGLTPDPKNWTQLVDAIKSFAQKANVHDPANNYKKGARVQNGIGGAWYESLQDVPVNQALTNNQTYWLPAPNFPIFGGDAVLTTGRNLTADDINKHLICGATTETSYPLPLANSVPAGSMLYVRGGSAVSTFNASGGDKINIDNVEDGVTSCSCLGIEVLILVSSGDINWRLTKINPRLDSGVVFANGAGSNQRQFNVFFTNNSSFNREVSVVVDLSANARATLVQDNFFNEVTPSTAMRATLVANIPPKKTYFIGTNGAVTFVRWVERNLIV